MSIREANSHHEGTKHALSKAEGNTKFKIIVIRTLRVLRTAISKFARLAQMF